MGVNGIWKHWNVSNAIRRSTLTKKGRCIQNDCCNLGLEIEFLIIYHIFLFIISIPNNIWSKNLFVILLFIIHIFHCSENFYGLPVVWQNIWICFDCTCQWNILSFYLSYSKTSEFWFRLLMILFSHQNLKTGSKINFSN